MMPIPPDFSSRSLSIEYVKADDLMRIFRTPHGIAPAPLYYGTGGKFRFDCPVSMTAAPPFGVTYAAFDLPTCFAETVTRDANRNALQFGGIAVSESAQIRPRYVADLYASALLRLADVTDLGLYKLGAESGEFNSPDYPRCTQPWALEIFNRPEGVDGLLYRSRFLNGRLAVAIFERGAIRVSLGAGTVSALEKHVDYAATLKELGIVLIA